MAPVTPRTTNVVVRLAGRTQEALLPDAHYDILTDSVGAGDDALGVAAMVESVWWIVLSVRQFAFTESNLHTDTAKGRPVYHRAGPRSDWPTCLVFGVDVRVPLLVCVLDPTQFYSR